MAYHSADLPVITFSSGATSSAAIAGFDDAELVTIGWTATATGTTYTVEVEFTETGSSFKTLQRDGSDVTITASEAVPIDQIGGFRQIRLTGTGANNAGPSFPVIKKFLV